MGSDELQIEIREASEADADAIRDLQRRAFHQQAVLYDDYMLPPLTQTRDELIADFKEQVFLKALHEGRVVGSVRGRAEAGTCHVSRLIVHPEFQNRGIGKKLMLALEKKFPDAGRFELFTGHRSEKNLALYATLGYREFMRKPQSDKVTLICLEKIRV